MLRPFSSGNGDCHWESNLCLCLCNQPSRPMWPSHSSVGRCSYYCWWLCPLLGKKQWAPCNNSPCYQDCWHTDLVDWRCLLATEQAIQHVLRANLMGLTFIDSEGHSSMQQQSVKIFLYKILFFFTSEVKIKTLGLLSRWVTKSKELWFTMWRQYFILRVLYSPSFPAVGSHHHPLHECVAPLCTSYSRGCEFTISDAYLVYFWFS